MELVSVDARGMALTLPRNLMREEQRCEPREDADGASATLFVRGRAGSARVLNISVHGAMIETDVRMVLDEHVVITFDGCTPVHASVRWTRDGRVGLHFGRELVLA